MSAKRAAVLVIALFLLTLLVRLPAAWVTPLLPLGVRCVDPGGTLWSGGCGQLELYGTPLSAFHWQLHPLSLLRARLEATLGSDDPGAPLRAELSLHLDGEIDAHALQAMLPLNAAALFPRTWSGTLQASVDELVLIGGHVRELRGLITVRDLRGTAAANFGNLELSFAGTRRGDALVGQLRDLGGPLALNGELLLKPDGGYQLDGTIAGRDSAEPALQQLLQLLGPADAQGRRVFSLAGTL